MPTDIQVAIVVVGFLLFLLGVLPQNFEAFGFKLPPILDPKFRWLSLGLGVLLLLFVPIKVMFFDKPSSSVSVRPDSTRIPNLTVDAQPTPSTESSRSAQSSPQSRQKQVAVAFQKKNTEVDRIDQLSKQKVTNQVTANHSKSAQTQQISDSPGAVQVGGNVGSINLNQSPGENSARLRSELTKLVRYPEAVPDEAKGRTSIEWRLANKLPARVFDLLMRYDEKTILGTPEIGPTLQKFLGKYYQFRQRTMNLEERALQRIGQIVAVRFRAAWDIYFRYAVMRFGGLPKDEIISGGNFLNYDITWDDAERVYAELSKEPSLSREFSDIFAVNREVIQEVRNLGTTLEQEAVTQRNQ